MTSTSTLWQRAQRLRDELAVQAHLMSMELHDEWDQLRKRLQQLEQRMEQQLIDKASRVGRAEEVFFVGNREEIAEIVADLEALQARQARPADDGEREQDHTAGTRS